MPFLVMHARIFLPCLNAKCQLMKKNKKRKDDQMAKPEKPSKSQNQRFSFSSQWKAANLSGKHLETNLARVPECFRSNALYSMWPQLLRQPVDTTATNIATP